MVSIFAREITDDLASLVKQIDKKVSENADSKMAAFVVLLSEDPDADESKLKALAAKHGIKNVPLTIFDGVAGPPRYKISEDADVTVLMWSGLKVKANFAFTNKQLEAKSITQVVSGTSKILN